MFFRTFGEQKCAASGNFKSTHHAPITVGLPDKIDSNFRATQGHAIIAPQGEPLPERTQFGITVPISSVEFQLDVGQIEEWSKEMDTISITAADEHYITCPPRSFLRTIGAFRKMNRRFITKR